MTTLLDRLENEATPEDTWTVLDEKIVTVRGEHAVTVEELKPLVGMKINHRDFTRKIKAIHSVITTVYTNADGRFLTLEVSATIRCKYFVDNSSENLEDTFMIWIEESEGGEITIGNFDIHEDGYYTPIEPEVFDKIMNRFEI